jgi:all-trans-8'-apo-beta-carotenal 15,15'-oxygenase
MVMHRSGADTWTAAFETLEDEIVDGVELEVDGCLPSELHGSLYRIGPARHDVYGERYRHWFDGDGMVHALTLGEGRVRYRNRFVATTKKRDEDAARKRLYAAFGSPPTGGPVARWRRAVLMSAANTNVVDYNGSLLALWEAAPPWRLDPITLETLGPDDLGGALGPRDPISAHPHFDPATGELWNFGVRYGPRTVARLYRTSVDGRTARMADVPLPFASFVHDFALTATQAVLVVTPLVLPRVPLAMKAGWSSYGQSLRWRPQAGTHVAVVDRGTGEARWYRTEPFFVFHTANAWDDGDDVVVDLCAYPDGSIVRVLGELMGGAVRSMAFARPERLRLGRNGAVERRRLAEDSLEFPRVADPVQCREHRRIYGVGWTDDLSFVGIPTSLDIAGGRATRAPMGPGEFAGECVPVAKAGGTTETDVWLLTLVIDALGRRSHLRILDGADLAAPPVATARLPHLAPAGFHGNWVPAAPSAAASPS